MKQSQEVSRFLFPSRQYATEPIHPAMCPLYNPTAGLKRSLSFNSPRLLTTRANMGGITKLFHQVSYLTGIITLIQRHTLRLFFCRFRTLYRNTLNRCLNHLAIMPISSINRQANRHAGCFGKQTAFNTLFGPIRRVWSGFFPRQAGLLLWRRPLIATTSQYLSTHHSVPDPSSRVSEKLQLPSTPETASGRCCLNKYQSHSKRSIDNQSEEQKEFRPLPYGPALSACRHQNDVYWDVWAAVVRSFPIICLKSCICFLLSCFSFLNPFKGIIAFEDIGNSGVIRIGS
jgi:hypothetical protein